MLGIWNSKPDRPRNVQSHSVVLATVEFLKMRNAQGWYSTWFCNMHNFKSISGHVSTQLVTLMKLRQKDSHDKRHAYGTSTSEELCARRGGWLCKWHTLRMVHTFALFAGFKGLIGVLLKDVVRLLAGFGSAFYSWYSCLGKVVHVLTVLWFLILLNFGLAVLGLWFKCREAHK